MHSTHSDDREYFTRTFNDRDFAKATACDSSNGCVFLPTDGVLDAVADSKTGAVLPVPAAGLVDFAKAS